jgi:hypothetical protein
MGIDTADFQNGNYITGMRVIERRIFNAGLLMAVDETINIAIAPSNMIETELIKKVAAIVNRDAYDTRLILAGQIPRIIAQCQSTQEAQAMAQRLTDLGLLAIVCKDSELHAPLQSFMAYTMEFKEREILFRDKASQERRLEAEDVFLILKGRKHIYIEEEKSNTEVKINLPATLITGGIPIFRRVKEQVKDPPLRSKYFIRLYDRKSSETSVEILQDYIEYSLLGTDMGLSSLVNFDTLTAKLREASPQAIYDDRLTKSLDQNMPSTSGQDDLETKLRLIYQFHLAQSFP